MRRPREEGLASLPEMLLSWIWTFVLLSMSMPKWFTNIDEHVTVIVLLFCSTMPADWPPAVIRSSRMLVDDTTLTPAPPVPDTSILRTWELLILSSRRGLNASTSVSFPAPSLTSTFVPEIEPSEIIRLAMSTKLRPVALVV